MTGTQALDQLRPALVGNWIRTGISWIWTTHSNMGCWCPQWQLNLLYHNAYPIGKIELDIHKMGLLPHSPHVICTLSLNFGNILPSANPVNATLSPSQTTDAPHPLFPDVWKILLQDVKGFAPNLRWFKETQQIHWGVKNDSNSVDCILQSRLQKAENKDIVSSKCICRSLSMMCYCIRCSWIPICKEVSIWNGIRRSCFSFSFTI